MELSVAHIVLLVILTLFLLVEVLVLLFLVYIASRGAPYVATDDKTVANLLEMIGDHTGKKAVDLGSGDGKILLALARQGIEVHGYEVNPLLVIYSRFRIKQAGVENKASVYWRDFWREDFSKYDILIIYGIPYMMRRLEKKLENEVTPGTWVILNTFSFPHWKVVQKNGNLRLYRK